MEAYFDNSATTRPFDEVIEYMSHVNRDVYGNPSSLHTKGIEAEKLIKRARETIADTVGANSSEIYFTSGGTESDNLAIRGFLEANPRNGKHIITTRIEHPAVLEVYKHLEENGYSVDYIGVDSNGIIKMEELAEKIREDTALISVIYVNNEVGSIQPVKQITVLKNSINPNTAIFVDAVQAYGKIKILPRQLGIDMMSMSSHKIHGPKGVGALYISRQTRVKPIVFGGGQESHLRSGTENVPGICGFGLAAEMISGKLEQNIKHIKNLKKLFVDRLNDKLEDFSIISPADGIPYILNISFGNVKAEVLLHHLEEKGIYVSTGSACSSRKRIQSHVLEAMCVKQRDMEGAIRFSFSALNTDEEVEYTVDAIKSILPEIQIRRGISENTGRRKNFSRQYGESGGRR